MVGACSITFVSLSFILIGTLLHSPISYVTLSVSFMFFFCIWTYFHFLISCFTFLRICGACILYLHFSNLKLAPLLDFFPFLFSEQMKILIKASGTNWRCQKFRKIHIAGTSEISDQLVLIMNSQSHI